MFMLGIDFITPTPLFFGSISLHLAEQRRTSKIISGKKLWKKTGLSFDMSHSFLMNQLHSVQFTKILQTVFNKQKETLKGY